MSTRANIVIRSNSYGRMRQLWFYRHSDGYPEGTLPTLSKFLHWIDTGCIRNNLSQACGRLILIGNDEYTKNQLGVYAGTVQDHRNSIKANVHNTWKVGAYEPTTCQHMDIEYLYRIDIDSLRLTINGMNFDWREYRRIVADGTEYKFGEFPTICEVL